MKVNKVDHICIAVRNLEQARKVWEPIMGKTKMDDEYIDESEKIKVARYWLGELGFELMESTTPDGDVAKFIEKNGEGYPFIPDKRGEIARPFRNCEFAFIHPRKVNGVLLEIIDDKWKELNK
jgi:methylmalonyl-CoA/ethylmalonyl-CoA epimerase